MRSLIPEWIPLHEAAWMLVKHKRAGVDHERACKAIEQAVAAGEIDAEPATPITRGWIRNVRWASVEAWFASGEPRPPLLEIETEPAGEVAKSRPPSRAELYRCLKEHHTKRRAEGKEPNERDDLKVAKRQFPGVSRQMVRDERRAIVPPELLKRGRREVMRRNLQRRKTAH